MKVVIAEKPSVARDIAAVLGIGNRKEGYLEGRGCAVTWAFGHLVSLQEPHDYDPALKAWRLDTLPVIPDEFRLKVAGNPGAAGQFDTIRRLFLDAEEIVCATDAGREGELIFRYILALAGCGQKPIRRLWLSSLTPEAIQAAFRDLKDGHAYDALYAAAKCRSEADWLVGLNATRCYTCRHGRTGGGGDRVLWSIGRVQTPVLAMIVRRDDEILAFRPKPFWELATQYRDALFKYAGDRFDRPGEAEVLLGKITGQPFAVAAVAGKRKTEQPPQLFDLTTLQREINKSHGLSAAETLAAAQNLYEAKLVTYPRTDSRYLGADMKPRIPGILRNLAAVRAGQVGPLDLDRLPFTGRIIDDKKVTDHHAIIPTGVVPRPLGAHEQAVFDAIATQFIAAFYPPCQKMVTTVDGESAGVAFQAKGTQVLEPGWTALFPRKKRRKAEAGEEEEEDEQALPPFEKGESGPHEPSLREGKTKPPNHFTENSLLGAMEAAGKLVDDDELREALKERGIGTPATRAAIIETLLRRNYVRREKKQLLATDMGRCLVALIRDPLLKSPEMTGEWEQQLKRIERGEGRPEAFMEGIAAYVRGLVAGGAARLDPARWGDCPLCGKEVVRGKSAYGCSGWKQGCPFVLPPDYKQIRLAPDQVRILLQMRILPYPVALEGQPRLLLLSGQGFAMDIGLPSAENQRQGNPAQPPGKARKQAGARQAARRRKP